MLKKQNEMNKGERILSTALIALMVLTLSFIFIQSLLPPTVSKGESDALAGFLSLILPPDGFILRNLRSIAHFIEFGVLGGEIALYILLFSLYTYKLAALSPVLGLIVAFIDETIQIFSGRAAEITDVWTDLFGFSSFVAIVMAVFFLITALSKKDEING